MKLLANENIPLASVYALRQAGFDITAISELSPGVSDAHVLRLAEAESRALLTFDRDYGELIYVRGLPCPPGLVYMRFLPTTPTEPSQLLIKLFAQKKNIVQGYFVVLDRDSIRRRALPVPANITK
ncbi:MAG: DUF5615 family PIN-like protein [Gammaproteobacteria bacterium]|nr:DUF5615 family PIN-like protein [Gammaproteobacteria bacterium]